jgi:hypothetical protein
MATSARSRRIPWIPGLVALPIVCGVVNTDQPAVESGKNISSKRDNGVTGFVLSVVHVGQGLVSF